MYVESLCLQTDEDEEDDDDNDDDDADGAGGKGWRRVDDAGADDLI